MKRREEKPTRDCSPHKDFVGRVRQRLYRKLLLSRQVRSGVGDAMDVGDKAESAAADGGRIDRETTAADTANKGNPENPGATTTAATNPARPNPAGAGHSDDDSGCALEEYTWVPPGLKPDQVG